MICVKATFDCELVTEFSSICADFEILTLKCAQNIFSVVYRPPSGSSNKVLCYFDKFLDFSSANKYNFFVGGDFNVNMLTTSSVPCSFKSVLDSNDCVYVITSPTHVTSVSSTLIDLFITNTDLGSAYGGVIGVQISDHLPIFMIASNVNVIHCDTPAGIRVF